MMAKVYILHWHQCRKILGIHHLMHKTIINQHVNVSVASIVSKDYKTHQNLRFDLLMTIFLPLKFQWPISQNSPMRLVLDFVEAGHICCKKDLDVIVLMTPWFWKSLKQKPKLQSQTISLRCYCWWLHIGNNRQTSNKLSLCGSCSSVTLGCLGTLYLIHCTPWHIARPWKKCDF